MCTEPQSYYIKNNKLHAFINNYNYILNIIHHNSPVSLCLTDRPCGFAPLIPNLNEL